MLQNRVTPYGSLIKTPARGTWTGTRGLIHNDKQEIVRAYKLKAWITCRLQFKGRQRKVMSPGLYTELFFLDEATAFAAGHRPCCECRREDFNRFKSAWLQRNPQYGFDMKSKIAEIDNIIHNERMDRNGHKVIVEMKGSELPNGSIVSINDEAYLIKDRQMFLWTPFGYGDAIALPLNLKFNVLTPLSVVNALWHYKI